MTLLDMLQRSTNDPVFVDQIQAGDLSALGLTESEHEALRTMDEDAMRSMCGVVASAQYAVMRWVSDPDESASL
jgi:hypothetical protein